MKKQLISAMIITLGVMALFIAGVIITEKVNLETIRSEYSQLPNSGNAGLVDIPAPTQKAVQFEKNKVAVWIVRFLLSLAIPAFLLFSGWSAGVRNWARSQSKNFIVILALYFIIYSCIDYLLSFPLDFYSGFVRLHSYGLSNQPFTKWLGDSLKSFAINTFSGAAFVWLPYLAIKKSPGRWWLYMALLSIPVLIFISYISPVFIDPLFNKYQPIQDKALEEKLRSQISRTVIRDCQLYQVDKSVDTNQMNAYMTGMFNTKRIVLWDTTIRNLSQREVLGVTAHEMGHYALGHVWKSIGLGALLCAAVLYLVHKSALWILDRSGGAFGFTRLYDIASLPLLILLINLFMFAAAPVENAYSRHMETEADRFELELTRDNQAAASAMVKLHQGSLTLPQPGIIYKLWSYDHPTFKERVDFANSYRPWEENRPLRYQKYFVNF
ncbi:MAG: M48 family metallopeptidase [Clostridiales bacterium]|jgi:Zn-dependent protease with chaperone function|nr:M48 family metallopeptidase [Eubacteriales bacterium]MDH7566735.1 M48 family metallopeptidase [Clostridiales bacterium]